MPTPLGFLFDASQVAPTAPMGAVPAGAYNVQITSAVMKPLKNDASQSHLELTFEIIDGQYKGRKGWVYLNLHNPDEQKRAMAHGDFSSICRAVNIIQITDAEQLCGRPLTCDFKLVKGTEQYPDDKNQLRNFKPYAGPAAPVATASGLPSAPAAPAPVAFAQPAPLAAPPAMPQGFPMPGQQTQGFAPPAPPMASPAGYAPPAPAGFAPPPAPGMLMAPWGQPGR